MLLESTGAAAQIKMKQRYMEKHTSALCMRDGKVIAAHKCNSQYSYYMSAIGVSQAVD
jgi:hypothetical protein